MITSLGRFRSAFRVCVLLTALLTVTSARSQAVHLAAANNVTWSQLGANENDSMPLGNGDLALNVWTETNGDIVVLAAKSDAWSENGQLLKLGRVRIKLTPNPFVSGQAFSQSLKLESGEIDISSGHNLARIWVDANHPVAHADITTENPVHMEVTSELWRTRKYHLGQRAVQAAGFFEWGNDPEGLDFDPDTVLPASKNQIFWCHFNSHSIYPLVFNREHLESLLPQFPDPLLHRCFGLEIKGDDLVCGDDHQLTSSHAGKRFHLGLYALTEQTASADTWKSDLESLANSIDQTSANKAFAAHVKWWGNFWNRSYIHVNGSDEAAQISQSYAMQRYMTACAGRGAQPIKFNGSLFSVGHDLPEGTSSNEREHDPDFRAWGASFWNQNTRHIYWPLIASGDFDLLAPWFDMYVQALPLASARTQNYFHHDGAAFIETIYFWGLPNVNDFGWNNQGPELQSEWMRYHIQGGLEVLAQMLDRYDYTQDESFARKTLLPMADAVITYYDQHWKRDADGKILMSPAQAIETYQRDAVDPAPDIAGLMDVLPRLAALPVDLATGAERALWVKMQNELPPLPIGTTMNGKLPPKGIGAPDGKKVLLPALHYGDPKNAENPELYAVFPYRLYSVGKSDLQLALDTFEARRFPFAKCWGQDGEEAALLGLADEAKTVVQKEFTSYGNQRFVWFWSKNSDWIPDMDNGGAGMATLQFMLMQCNGQEIRLLPAWPKDWTADFKLCAPYQTTVEGHVENGRISHLIVNPPARAKDVVTAN